MRESRNQKLSEALAASHGILLIIISLLIVIFI